MESRALPAPTGPLEAWVAWYAACLGTVLAAVARLPSVPMRVFALVAGTALATALSPAYLRRATPFSAVVITAGAAAVSTATVIRLAGLPWRAWGSLSQAGGTQRPSAWLLTTTAWCFGLGLLATGRLVVREGFSKGRLGQRGYRVASILPVVAFTGFLIVGLCQVGGTRALALVHNLAAWTAMSSFWVGMLASPWMPSLSAPLRYYSAFAAVAVFGTWLPSGLRFVGITGSSPISTLNMELLVFPLCLAWLGWLAWEWGEPSTSSEAPAAAAGA